jgi:hypothetical protein
VTGTVLIDHVELDQAARAFLKEGHDLAITINALLGKIDDLGDVYGDDDSGRQAKKSFPAYGVWPPTTGRSRTPSTVAGRRWTGSPAT